MSLYISGQRADLDDASFLLMNWTRDEASSPAAVRNSFSQQVTLQATPANNAIFGCFFRPDRVTGDGGFDPLARTDFDLIAETGDRLSKGYLKLDSVATGAGRVASYTVTLYGGLGGFFYALSNRDDGQKRSLADMKWLIPGSEDDPIIPAQEGMSLTAAEVRAAWDTLDPDSTVNRPLYRLVNFAPCLNGIPDKGFDAKHAVYEDGNTPTTQLYGLYTTSTKDGVTYGPPTAGPILIDLPKGMTEWEMQDLRAYLQRPVVSLWQFLKSVAHTSKDTGYELVLDSATFDGEDVWIKDSWLTLPLFDRENFDPTDTTLAEILTGTPSPAEVLVSVAKALGLVFVYDDGDSTVTLMARSLYYTNDGAESIDLEGRVGGAVTIEPNLMDRRFYIWGWKEVPGAFASQYEETYGVQYGAQRVNTGYGFSDESTEAMSGTALRGAADVQDTDALYWSPVKQISTSDRTYYSSIFKFAAAGTCSWYLYSGQLSIQCTATDYTDGNRYASGMYAAGWRHFMVMPQFCDDDGKAEDGSMCLLFLDGMKDSPLVAPSQLTLRVPFKLSDDTAAMLEVNNGSPCWDITVDQAKAVTRFPNFRRWKVSDTADACPCWDFGEPLAVGFTDPPQQVETLYDRNWAAYVADRFDRDTKVLRAKVDLSGLEVGSGLLRRFFTWGGCRWSLNRIINYSITTNDLTECEFVQVKDIKAYTG